MARAYLALVVLAVVLLGFGPTRNLILDGTEFVLDRWDERWSYRVDHGVELVAAAQYEEAIAYLASLDARFPATNVRHGRDQDRERILRALGESFELTGRKGRALEAFRRAVLFDPLNYVNHESLANAALLFQEPAEALVHLRAVLSLNPAHLPACAKLVELQLADANWQGVIDTYQAYVDSYVIQHLVVEFGEHQTLVPVQADGRFHEVLVLLSDSMAAALRRAGQLRIGPGAFGLELSSLELEPPVTPGRFAIPPLQLSAPAGPAQTGWLLPALNTVPPPHPRTTRVREPDPDSHPDRRITVPLSANAPAAVALRLNVRLVKPVDPATWSAVETAHRNRLQLGALEQLRARSFVSAGAEE